MAKGWIKLHRRITESDSYHAEPFCRIMAWIDLLLLANHDDNFFRVRGVRVDVKCGQVGYTSENLAKRWRWSRGKVIRYLKELESEQQIVQQKNNVTTLISIINYARYQTTGTAMGTTDDTASSTTESQQTVQQTDINKNVKNEKNVKNDKEDITGQFIFFIQKFNSITGRGFRGGDKERKQFSDRLKDGFSVENMEIATVNCFRDKFHIENPQYLTPEFILRHDKLEKYLNYITPIEYGQPTSQKTDTGFNPAEARNLAKLFNQSNPGDGPGGNGLLPSPVGPDADPGG